MVELRFHGTKVANIDSILAKGLLGPDDEGYNKANEQAYGPGVYTTSSVQYAKQYGTILILGVFPDQT